MNFGKVIEMLDIGECAKLPEWDWYIFKKDNCLWMKGEDNNVFKQHDFAWLNSVMWREDWQVLSRTVLGDVD